MSDQNKPSLSIIVPTYNRGERALEKISSNWNILDQAAKSFDLALDLCIVDDGSTPSPLPLFQSFFEDDPRVKIRNNATNQGPGIARNNGLNVVKGDWVWFLDDDDDLLSDEVPKLFQTLIQNLDKDVIAHSLDHEYDARDAERVAENLAENVLLFREKQEVYNLIIKRNLLVDHGITFSQGYHEDIRLVVETLLTSRLVCTHPYKAIEKNVLDDAITAKMNAKRISGYLTAFQELDEKELISDSNQVLIQCVGVILLLIYREKDPNIAQGLVKTLKDELTLRNYAELLLQATRNVSDTSPNFELAAQKLVHNFESDAEEILTHIHNVFDTHLTCKDIESSLFLGPDEIRACCKRFFVDNKRKGDVVLLKANPDITLSDINNAKANLVARLNSGEASECSGCPYIERCETTKSKIEYISFENFSYCNMRCTYCSPRYYGGTEASYSTTSIIEDLSRKKDLLSDRCHVVWGGGEPTLSPSFNGVNAVLSSDERVNKVRVLSNSLRYSSHLEANMKLDKYHLVTSIDAGTQEVFSDIRGRGKIDDVIDNLVKYKTHISDPKHLTVKYILTAQNGSSEELTAFVEKIAARELQDCLFQISCNFESESNSLEITAQLYELATRLFIAGANHVFMDDLIRDRTNIQNSDIEHILKHLKSKNLPIDFIETYNTSKKIVLWGVGRQAEWIKNYTSIGRSGKIVAVVRNAEDWRHANEIHGEKLPIIPAGVQSMAEIITNIEQAGLQEHYLKGIAA